MKNSASKTIIAILFFILCSLYSPVFVQAAQIHKQANITIQNIGAPISKNIWGVDFQPAIDLSSTNPQFDLFQYISQAQWGGLGVTIVRFPGGCAADYYDIGNLGSGVLSYQTATGPVNRQFFTLKNAMDMNAPIGADILFQVNIDGNIAGGTDVVSLPNSCGATSLLGKDFPTLLNDLNRMLSDPQYSTIADFEIGNEQWLNWDPSDYQTRAVQVAHAIKAANPNARVGVIDYPSLRQTSATKTAWNQMIQSIIKNTNDCGAGGAFKPCFDFVTDHEYPRARMATSPFSGQAAYYPITNQNQLVLNLNSYTGKNFGVSEWNLPCTINPPNSPVSMVNTVDHGMFAFTSLMIMAQDNVGLATYHDMSINSTLGVGYGCGLFADPSTYTAAGQAFAFSAPAAGGDNVTSTLTFPKSDGYICLPDNSTCTDADCIVGSPTTCAQNSIGAYSTVSAYAVKQANDLLIFLVNRNDAAANPDQVYIDAQIIMTIFPSYTSYRTIDQLAGGSYNTNSFAQTNIETDQPQTTAQFLVSLPPTSITRIRLRNHYLNAPTPTPTSMAHPTLNFTTVQKFVNSKRPTVPACKVTLTSICFYVYAVAMYIMVIHFAIAMKEEFKLNLLVTCFVIGGAIGYHLCHLEYGFILGMILSLFLW